MRQRFASRSPGLHIFVLHHGAFVVLGVAVTDLDSCTIKIKILSAAEVPGTTYVFALTRCASIYL